MSEALPVSQPDPVPELIRGLVEATLDGDQARAQLALKSLPQSAVTVGVGRPLNAREQLRIFRRDRFLCRYCGKRTLFVPVLRLLSTHFPDELRYHPHWRWNATHPVYWSHAASIDHLVPVARGGTSTVTNLVTSCYMCNSIKQHWLIEELRWSLLPLPDPEVGWDGLSSRYLDLCHTVPVGSDRYHAAWIRCLQQQR